MDRNKLDTMIEREMFAYADMIKEHAFDFTMLYLNRNNIDIDRNVAARLLEIVKTAIEDGKTSKIDFVKKRVDKHLDEWTEQENPTQPTGRRKGPRE